jgi:hypothetical protein
MNAQKNHDLYQIVGGPDFIGRAILHTVTAFLDMEAKPEEYLNDLVNSAASKIVTDLHKFRSNYAPSKKSFYDTLILLGPALFRFLNIGSDIQIDNYISFAKEVADRVSLLTNYWE